MLPDDISPTEPDQNEPDQNETGAETPDDSDAELARPAKAKLSEKLGGKQRRFLRAKGHLLTAVLHVGKEGVSDSLVKNALVQLQAHELIKVKVGESAPENRHRTAEALAAATDSELAQVLGRTFLLYKARQEKPEIKLPK